MKTRRDPKSLIIKTIAVFVWVFSVTQPVEFADAGTRLILQITVDQLRGDLPVRFAERFCEGGFPYLMKQGAWYNNAHYQHSNLETIVGHVVLATGAFPSAHGMVANVWLDRETGELVYAVEDSGYDIVGSLGGVDRKTEIDPTQAAARSDGRSPRAILTSTFSDELIVHTAGRAKVFGVSIKDRGAISMAGHAGKAFWFTQWISSRPSRPGWESNHHQALWAILYQRC